MAKKKILITGASGTVGFEVLKQLETKGCYDISVFDKKTKNSFKKFNTLQNKVNVIYGDITNVVDVANIPKNLDVVIHLAAIIPPLADEFPELSRSVNTGGTQNLIHQLEIYSPYAFLMYSSSISVYGDRIQNPMIKVDDPLIPSEGDVYAETKIASEKLIQDNKLDYTIFRLAAILGNHKMSKLMFHQPLNTSLEIATPRDTARAFVNGIEKQQELSRNIYNLGGGVSCRISYQHFLERSFAVFGLGKLNFPDKTFADKNFHCGFYEDGDNLEKIVHFRNDSLEDYFKMEAEKVRTFKKVVASLFRNPIKWYLLKQSEPYNAFKTLDKKQISHYFKLNA